MFWLTINWGKETTTCWTYGAWERWAHQGKTASSCDELAVEIRHIHISHKHISKHTHKHTCKRSEAYYSPPLIDDGSWLKAPTLMIAQKNDALPFTVTGLLPNFYQSEPEHETRFWVGNQSYSCKLCGVDECSFKDTLLDYYTVDKILLILDCT